MLEPRHIAGILLRGDQFVVAAADKVQQVGEKLAHVGRADVVLQTELAEPLAQVDPQIFLVEHTELPARRLQQLVAIIVEGGGVNLPAAQQSGNAAAHLLGGIPRIGEGENLLRFRVSFLNQAGDSVGQNRGFSGSRAGHDQHRTVNVLNRFLLALVGTKCGTKCGTRLGLGRRHRGQHITARVEEKAWAAYSNPG